MRFTIIFFFHFICTASFANNDFSKACERLQNNPNHRLAIDSVNLLLKYNNLTDSQSIRLYTIVLHKYSMLQHFDTCLNIAEKQLMLAKKKGILINQAIFLKHIGNTYYYLSQLNRAIEYYDRSLSIAIPNNYYEISEDCTHNIAGARMEQGKADSITENYLIKAIYYNTKTSNPRVDRQVGHYRLLATLYDYQNKLDRSQAIYEQLLKLTREHKQIYDEMTTLCFYSRILSKRGKHKEAIDMSYKSTLMAKPFNDPDALSATYSIHADNLKHAGMIDSAFQTLKILQTKVMERYRTSLSNSIAEAEAKFKNAEAEFEKNAAISESKRKVQLYTTVFVFSFLLLIGGGLFYLNRKKAQDEKDKMKAIVNAEEQEKDRVSKELHDGIGQMLGAAKLNLHAYEEDPSKEILDKAIKLIDESATELRTVSHSLAPVTLTKNGLVLSIKKFLDSFKSNHLKISFHSVENKIELENTRELVIYRIIQECVSNAIKHAMAKNLFVSLDINEGQLVVMIEDDGKGFDMNAIDKKDGIGLFNMQVRTEYLHGTMEIDSRLNQGTVFSFRFPLK